MLEILYEDNHLIAVNKRSGDLLQPAQNDGVVLPDLVKAYIADKYNKPGAVFLGVLHRLDQPVTGVVLFARTSKATTRMHDQFRKRTIKKTYLALVSGSPPNEQAELRANLLKNAKLNKSYHAARDGKGKPAHLTYQWLATADHIHLLQVKPITGRHHQIRVMLSDIGCPIVGDLKYGAPKSNKDGSICLHAHSLEFIHPVTKEPTRISARLPKETNWRPFEGQVSL